MPPAGGLDLFWSGTSCKDHSRLKTTKQMHVGCLRKDTGGCSSYTYKHGWQAVHKNVQPMFSFFENVTTLLEFSQDKAGKQQKPAIFDVKKHCKKLGYSFSYTQVDSQLYLVRQRRNRVWGHACRSSDTSWKEMWADTLLNFGSQLNFPFTEVFAQNLPIQKVENSGQSKAVMRAIQKASTEGKGQDLFIDVTTSESRNEFNISMLPCVNPKHPVYSTRMERFVLPEEFLSCQGIWANDYPVPAAVQKTCKKQLAQDLAGQARLNFYSCRYCTVLYSKTS